MIGPNHKHLILDEEIISLIISEKKGDFDLGMENLANKYAGTIHTIIQDTCGWPTNDPYYDDLYNRVLMKIFRSVRNGFRDQEQLSAYIETVAEYTAIDAKRRRDTEHRRSKPHHDDRVVTQEPITPLQDDPIRVMGSGSRIMAIKQAFMKVMRRH